MTINKTPRLIKKTSVLFSDWKLSRNPGSGLSYESMSVLKLVLKSIKILYNGKAFIGYWCFGAFWSANNLPWPWPCTTDLASNFLTKWQFWQLTLKWLSRARAQDKTKQYYCCFFFPFLQDFIQLCDSRIRDSCEIGFRVQFNAEFPRQVMNFPI